jgi:cytochrome c
MGRMSSGWLGEHGEMDSKVNMAVGALLGTVFVLMSVSIASKSLFESPEPEKPGFVIAGAETAATQTAAVAAVIPIEQLLPKADPAKGEAIFKKCQGCHTNVKGAGNKVGPNLYGVVGRPIASIADFSYSAGMKKFSTVGKVWDFDHIYAFLAGPKKYVDGTAMGFAGLKKDEDRANLIAYLNTQSDKPLPVPAK